MVNWIPMFMLQVFDEFLCFDLVFGKENKGKTLTTPTLIDQKD